MIESPPQDLVADVERLLEEVEALGDPVARDKATAVVRALFELYGAGLERIVDAIAASEGAAELALAFADDELISHLLLLHGLHPMPLEQRVLDALEEVRPYLESHGGDVELVGIEGAVVRLQLQGSCSGCPSSTMTLKLAIENAIRKTAPEIEEVRAEEPAPREAGPPLIQLEVTPAAMGGTPAAIGGEWAMAGGLPELAAGRPVVKAISGTPLLFLKVGRQAYAYRTGCPACQSSLDGAALNGTELTCRECGNRYDVLRAGRGLDAPQLHLEPVPLLEDENGLVRVALPVPA